MKSLLLNPKAFVGMCFPANLKGSDPSFLNAIYANNPRDVMHLIVANPSTDWREAIWANNPEAE